jgi:hypothetical protein
MTISYKLSDYNFNSMIRWVKQADLGRLLLVLPALEKTMKRVKATRRLRKAFRGVPEGSAHCDYVNIIDWLEQIKPEDTEAIVQVISLDATIQNRIPQ